jgi:hypothetical protein
MTDRERNELDQQASLLIQQCLEQIDLLKRKTSILNIAISALANALKHRRMRAKSGTRPMRKRP